MLSNKVILLISPESWTHLFVSKHHYAIHLSKNGNRVYFLNPPSHRYAITASDVVGVKILDYKGLLPGLRWMPKFIRRIEQLRKLRKLERLAEVEFSLIWSFDNSVFFDLDIYPKKVMTISHIVDHNMDFCFARSSRSAAVCLGSSRFIVEKQKSFNPYSFFVHHGYDPVEPTPFQLPEGKGIKVGYAGNLGISYMDWTMLTEVFNVLQEVTFYFAGKNEPEGLEHPNVRFTGPLNKPQLATFYQEMDILIIAYDADRYREQLANPHKMMEYLGTGKAVVSTYTAEFEDLDFIAMSSRNGEWPELLREVVDNLDHWNSRALQEQRIAYARANTYDRQLDRINDYILTSAT